MSRNIAAGILAHVDAGKTTCIENMLAVSGVIRSAGRVDHGDTVLDYDSEERLHGITIYAKETHFHHGDAEFWVIDTPGHVDFSSEMERSLSVLDLAVLLINGQDGVQSHTETIWKCLEHYHVPVIVFINKMDISHISRQDLLHDLQQHCSASCIDFSEGINEEALAECDEKLLDAYAEGEHLRDDMIAEAFVHRSFFPVLYGSALKGEGIKELLDWMNRLMPQREWPEEFGARVFRVSVDDRGERLCHARITGGVLRARMKISEEEKVDQIRFYTGVKYEAADEAEAGTIAVLKGLKNVNAGDGLGFEEGQNEPLLSPYMNYEVAAAPGCDLLQLSRAFTELAQEDPQLHVEIDPDTHHISLQIMGKMQMEVLQKKIQEKCGISIAFAHGRILYHETILKGVDGAGHFEPLRHYAEVHVHLEPLARDKGIVVDSSCGTDDLSAGWQRSILSALRSKRHRGVLTGSFLSDVKITLTAGKGSVKHTEGGDFRQAALRAVRQALCKADNVLLEPYETFTLKIPSASMSRALYDLEQRHCSVQVVSDTQVEGRGPVRLLLDYQDDVTGYTRGQGIFRAEADGYDICQDAEEIIARSGYDPDLDLRNPSSSVFCEHGKGVSVPWNEADARMDIQLDAPRSSGSGVSAGRVDEDEVKRVFASLNGRNRNAEKEAEKEYRKKQEKEKADKQNAKVKASPHLPVCLIVDGYNMIFSWKDLKEAASQDISLARDMLVDRLCAYQAYTGDEMIIVFDGYKRKDNNGTTEKHGKVSVVYTRTDQTADAWIEKASYDMNGKYALSVASSDALIQNTVFSQGALRISARELEDRVVFSENLYREKGGGR